MLTKTLQTDPEKILQDTHVRGFCFLLLREEPQRSEPDLVWMASAILQNTIAG